MKRIKRILEKISEAAGGCQKFTVIGSTNMMIQGINVLPEDIDIVLNSNQLENIKENLEEFIKEDIHPRRIPGTDNICRRMVLEIEGLDIEIFEEEPEGVYRKYMDNGGTIKTSIEDLEVQCLKLEKEKETYREIGREKRVEEIEEFLND